MSAYNVSADGGEDLRGEDLRGEDLRGEDLRGDSEGDSESESESESDSNEDEENRRANDPAIKIIKEAFTRASPPDVEEFAREWRACVQRVVWDVVERADIIAETLEILWNEYARSWRRDRETLLDEFDGAIRNVEGSPPNYPAALSRATSAVYFGEGGSDFSANSFCDLFARGRRGREREPNERVMILYSHPLVKMHETRNPYALMARSADFGTRACPWRAYVRRR